MPNLVGLLNLFLSEDFLLKVRSKFDHSNTEQRHFPILLPKNSYVNHIYQKEIYIFDALKPEFTLY